MFISLKAAVEEDVDYVYMMICELQGNRPDYNIFKTHYGANLADDRIMYYIILYGSAPCGFISIHKQVLLHHNDVIAEIQEFVIESRFRSKGAGERVIMLIREILGYQGIKQVEVCTNRKRDEARKFYIKCGFSESHSKFTMTV